MKVPPSDAGRSHKRPARACTARTPARLARLAPTVERSTPRKQAAGESELSVPMPLTVPPPLAQKQRWDLRSMWELASIFNFFNVFRPVLKLGFEFTIEELETALITSNATLDEIHIALVKAIPPISRSPLGRDTWVTVLCKKLKDWWPWVAEGPFPLVPYHGEEVATYKELDPEIRVVILKALCEVRLDQDDLRTYIDDSLKQGVSFSTFRKERLGVDMLGNTYWYEHDSIAGQRLYREIRKVDNRVKFKGRGHAVPPSTTCNWETLATNLEEFQAVAEKLTSSRNRLEAAIGRRILADIVPELEELQKKRERTLKRQQRQAVLLDSYLNYGGLSGGRSRRERKPVTYTFDDFDRSITEAIKLTKKRQLSPSPEPASRLDNVTNGDARDAENTYDRDAEVTFTANHLESDHRTDVVSESKHDEDTHSSDSKFTLNVETFRNRQHRRPQRYSEREFVEVVSDNEADAYSDDEIEGEAVYDDDYVNKKKSRKLSVSSDGDEDYRGDEDGDDQDDEDDDDTDFDDGDFIHERRQRRYGSRDYTRQSKVKPRNDDDDDDDDDDGVDTSDDEDYTQERRRQRYASRGTRRGKVKSVDELQHGLRRSKRATRNNINYSKYEDSDFDDDDYPEEPEKPQRNDRLVQHKDIDRVMQDTETHPANIAENMHSYTSDGSEGGAANSVHERRQVDVGILTENSHKIGLVTPFNGVKSSMEGGAKSGNKQRRLLDLNLVAPVGGGNDDGSAEETRGQSGSSNERPQEGASSDDDGSTGNGDRKERA